MDEPGSVLTTLYMHGTIQAAASCIVFAIFTIISALLVMNMLLGVLCEVVSAVTRKEQDESAVKLVKESILLELKKYDDGDGMISHDELNQVLQDPHSQRILCSLDVDRLFLTELETALFHSGGEKVPIR